MSDTPKCDSALSRLAGHLDQADLDRYLAAINADQQHQSLVLKGYLNAFPGGVQLSLAQLRAALELAGLRLVPVDAKP